MNLKILSLACFCAGTVVASWSLTREVAGTKPFTVVTNILFTKFSEFNENIEGKINRPLFP